MEIIIKNKEIIEILIKYLQPIFPNKEITGKGSYGDFEFTITDKEEIPKE